MSSKSTKKTKSKIITTAEAFSADIIRLVRLYLIQKVELLSATEYYTNEEAALTSSQFSHPIILVEARLISSLSWHHNTENKDSNMNFENINSIEFNEENKSIFTYQISFLLPRETSEAATTTTSLSSSSSTLLLLSRKNKTIEDDNSSFITPQTILSANWCAQLQKKLAICAALTGLPTQLYISLLPFVPHLSWEIGRDGILGATHNTTMMSNITNEDINISDIYKSNSYNDSSILPGYMLRVALLLNANIPLGKRAGLNTAVLILYAIDGEICFSSSSSSSSSSSKLVLQERKKRLRTQNTSEIIEEKELFPYLLHFSETYLIPFISWENVWSKTLQREEENNNNNNDNNNNNNNNHNDVCELRNQLGSSFYLQGALDPRSVQSITIIIDVPISLWRHIFKYENSMNSNSNFYCDEKKNNILSQFAKRIAETIEGAMSRLAAENIDCFLRRAIIMQNKEKEEELNKNLKENNNETLSSPTSVIIGRKEGGESKLLKSNTLLKQSSSLLAQSIADSLAQIVRSSQNQVFIAEVHRLLLQEQTNGRFPPLLENKTKNNNKNNSTNSFNLNSSNSAATTAALLRWAVENRLMER